MLVVTFHLNIAVSSLSQKDFHLLYVKKLPVYTEDGLSVYHSCVYWTV